MNLRTINYIIAVAELGNFHKAAARCSVSQPALSAAVKLFEQQLGLPIFERSTRRVCITKAGQLIINQAKVIQGEVEALSELAQYHQESTELPFRIGAIGTIAPFLFPELIACLKKRFSHLNLQIFDERPVILTQQLLSGDLDAAVVVLPYQVSGIICQELYQESLVVILPQHHPLASSSEIEFTQIEQEQILLLKSGSQLREQIIKMMPQLEAQQTQERFAGTSLQTLVLMVEAGMGITVLPKSALKLLENHPILTWKPFKPGEVQIRTVALAWRANQERTHLIGHIQRAIMQVNQKLVQHST